MKNIRLKFVRVIVPFFISAGLLVFLLQKVDISKSIKIIKQADFSIIFVVLLISAVGNFFVNSYRWKLILKYFKCDLKWSEALFIQIGSDPVISILPLKTGELSRVVYLKKRKELSYPKSGLSILCEYILNFLVLIVSMLIGLGGYILFFDSASVACLSEKNIFCFSINLLVGKNTYNKIRDKLFRPSLKYFGQIKPVFKNFRIILLSGVFLLSELWGVFLLTQALHFQVPFYSVLLFLPMVILISSLPISIQGMGVREASILFLFAGFAPQEKLLSLSFLYFVVGYLCPMVVGACFTGIYLNRVVKE